MEITRKPSGDVVIVELNGRVDGYWADHLNAELTEIVGEGKHHIRVDFSKVSFLSSAGIGVLVSFHKQLSQINGSFQVVSPSHPVKTVLTVTRLDKLLLAAAGTAGAQPVLERPERRLELRDIGFDIFDLDPTATMTCRAIGSPAPLASGGFTASHCTSLEKMSPAFAVGVGAFGGAFGDCQMRFGELISVAGATAYQPGDGTNVPDYLVAAGPLAAEVRVLYCLAGEGKFARLVRFESLKPGAPIGLSHLLSGCLDAVAADSVGIVIVAEAAGMVGAALRRSPTESIADGDFFSHPAVRKRLSYTAERAFVRSVALVAGIVTRTRSLNRLQSEHLRPIGRECAGHLHAAAFRFSPVEKGLIEIDQTVSSLFASDRLLGVMHLLSDDRRAGGAGESEFVRGACWISPLNSTWQTP